MKGYFFSILLTAFLLNGTAVFAQEANLSIPGQIPDIQEQISVDISPTIPRPGDEVTINIEAYGTDLNRAFVSWTFNGKKLLSGTGEKQVKFYVGQVGSTNTVNLSVTPVNGPAIVKTFSFTPAEIDMLWEANTYTPPFYKGKALFTPQAEVTFVAIPNMIAKGSRVSPSQAVYKWKVGFDVQGDKSGYGKNTFVFNGPIILRDNKVSVEGYSSADSGVAGTGSYVLQAKDPSALIYEDSALYGVLFNRALYGQYQMTDNEKKFNVYPFFFSGKNKNADIIYEWSLNDTRIPSPDTDNTMTFRKTEDQKGDARVAVSITGVSKILQAAQSQFGVYFDNSRGLFFGQ